MTKWKWIFVILNLQNYVVLGVVGGGSPEQVGGSLVVGGGSIQQETGGKDLRRISDSTTSTKPREDLPRNFFTGEGVPEKKEELVGPPPDSIEESSEEEPQAQPCDVVESKSSTSSCTGSGSSKIPKQFEAILEQLAEEMEKTAGEPVSIQV
eukprot:GSA25T00014816001.1